MTMALPGLGLSSGLVRSLWAGAATGLGGLAIVAAMGPVTASASAATSSSSSSSSDAGRVVDVEAADASTPPPSPPVPGSLLPPSASSSSATSSALAPSAAAAATTTTATRPTPSKARRQHEQQQRERGVLAVALGSAAGVMVSVSVVDLYLPLAWRDGVVRATAAVGVGAALFAALSACLERNDKLLGTDAGRMLPLLGGAPPPRYVHVHDEPESDAAVAKDQREHVRRNMRLGVVMFLALTAHNVPEGVAVVVSSSADEALGLKVAIAVAAHNFPEGMVVSAPLYAATGSRVKAVAAAFASGLSEFLGALLTAAVWGPLLRREPWLVEYVLCVVAGIMIAASVLELLPAARAHRRSDLVLVGGVCGALIMLSTMLVV